jgi:hypothetical protein
VHLNLTKTEEYTEDIHVFTTTDKIKSHKEQERSLQNFTLSNFSNEMLRFPSALLPTNVILSKKIPQIIRK